MTELKLEDTYYIGACKKHVLAGLTEKFVSEAYGKFSMHNMELYVDMDEFQEIVIHAVKKGCIRDIVDYVIHDEVFRQNYNYIREAISESEWDFSREIHDALNDTTHYDHEHFTNVYSEFIGMSQEDIHEKLMETWEENTDSINDYLEHYISSDLENLEYSDWHTYINYKELFNDVMSDEHYSKYETYLSRDCDFLAIEFKD